MIHVYELRIIFNCREKMQLFEQQMSRIEKAPDCE